jgi:hypothetical protein
MLLTLASGAVPWIEATTGIDVSPCHDADGTWNPGPDCGDIPHEPEVGGGAWPTCEPGALGGPSTACGPPSYGPDDIAAPAVTIVQPRPDVAIPLAGETADVAVTIDVVDDGWGVQRTSLRIDGMDIVGSEDDFPPWEIPTFALPEGEFVLEAVALDWANNEGVSAPVTIVVGDAPEPQGTETSDAESTSSGGDDDESTSTSDPPVDTSSATTPADAPPSPGGADTAGCSCRTGARTLGFALPLLLASLRRRGRKKF